MLEFDDVCREDFYYNGAYLSSFGGVVGSQSGFSTLSLLPQREHVTEKIIGVDGEYLASTRLSPRVFTLPLFFTDLSTYNLRSIAAWLDRSTVVPFYWKADTIYLNCIPDQNSMDLSEVYNTSGYTELKMIAHDPYFYEITPSNSTTALSTGTNNIAVTNLGNKPSYPHIKVLGSGSIVVSIYIGAVLQSTCTIANVSANIEIDTLAKRVYTGSTNKINDMTGTYPILPTGAFTIRIEGTVTSLILTPRFRWI